jgi:hypothetical protein
VPDGYAHVQQRGGTHIGGAGTRPPRHAHRRRPAPKQSAGTRPPRRVNSAMYNQWRRFQFFDKELVTADGSPRCVCMCMCVCTHTQTTPVHTHRPRQPNLPPPTPLLNPQTQPLYPHSSEEPHPELKKIKVTAAASGKGMIAMGDSEGCVTLCDRKFSLNKFQVFFLFSIFYSPINSRFFLILIPQVQPQ